MSGFVLYQMLILGSYISFNAINRVFIQVHSNNDLPDFLRDTYSLNNGQLQVVVNHYDVLVTLILPKNIPLKFNVEINTTNGNCDQRFRVRNFKNTCIVTLIMENNQGRILSYRRNTSKDELDIEKELELKNSNGVWLKSGQEIISMQIGSDDSDNSKSFIDQRRCLFERNELESKNSMINLDLGVSNEACPYTMTFEKDVILLMPKMIYTISGAIPIRCSIISFFIALLFILLTFNA